MKIRRHYLTLRRSFPELQEDIPFETTTQELASILDCTHRNMVLLLKRMQQENWITWTPKRGRGNRSLLTFVASKESIALQEAQEMVQKQDLHSALELLNGIDDSPMLREQFQDWLSSQFGFHSEVDGQRRTDVLRFPLPQTIHSLDPATIHYTGESHLVNQLYDGLLRMDSKGEQLLPHLAHAWEVDASRTLWTFYLRKGVLFHHGREMLSTDVSYSLQRLKKLAPYGLYSWVYEDIVSMETPDDTTIHIRLAQPNETFLAFLTSNRASIVPQDACETAGGQFISKPVGTGPFRMAGNEQGVWILEAFAPYFQGRAFLDRVEVWTLEESTRKDKLTELQPYQVMHNVRLSDMAAEQWQQVRQSGMTCKFITVNESKDGPLKNAAIRAAVDAAIDRGELLEMLSGDAIFEANSFWPQPDNCDLHAVPIQTDCYIKQLLDDAGYHGEKLIMATIPQYETDARIIQEICVNAGILLEIKLIAAEQFKGTARMTADLLLFAVMLDEHRELRLIDLFRSMQQHTLPDMHEMLERSISLILSEPAAKHRASHFMRIESQLKERHSLLFLYRKHLKTAFHPSIRGISLESLSWVRFRDIWFT